MPDFNSTLGIQRGEDGESVFLDTRPEHQIAPEAIHFAVLATLGEVAAAQAVEDAVVPASVHAHLMRPARPGRLVGRGRLLRRGRRLAFAEGEVLQDDRVVAKVSVTFAVL